MNVDPKTSQPARLTPGIPTIERYSRLAESPLFQEVARYSDAFLGDTRRQLGQYARHWVADPMRQWSRRWEYTFCCDHMTSAFAGGFAGRPMVLDAGSWITFFPYLLASKGMDVRACDIDPSLETIFPKVNAVTGIEIPFTRCRLTELDFEDASFDAAYCISVLEHCTDYEKIVDELFRVLRPGGLFVLTFDVSLDGRWEIPLPRARELLRVVGRRFASEAAADLASLLSFASEEEILTTRFAQERDPASLPWGTLSDLKSLVRLRLPRRPHKLLTCCALALRRRPGEPSSGRARAPRGS